MPGKPLNLTLSDDMIRRVEQYRYESHLTFRSQAIRALLDRALSDAGIPAMPPPRNKKSK